MILVLGILCSSIAAATMFWTITIYIPALAEEFAVDGEARRFPVVVAFMLGSLVSAISGPLAGRWMDTRGARETILVGSVMSAVALLATSQANELWQIGVGWGVVSIGRSMIFPVAYSWLVTRWFQRRRQMALGVLTIGFGIAGIGVLPLSMIEERWDWSAVMITSALLLVLINGLIALLLVYDRPAEIGSQVEGMTESEARASSSETAGFSIGEALRSPAFWLLAGAFMTFFIAPATFSTLQLDFFETSGVEQAALIVAIGAAVRGFSRLPFGLLVLGRIRRVFLLAIVVALTQVAALATVVISTSTPSLAVFVVMWGLGGAFVPMLEPTLINRTFGVRHFGTITGAMMMLAFPGTALGPIAAGALFDATGSYRLALTIMVCVVALSIVFFSLASLVVNGARHRQAAAARGMSNWPPGAADARYDGARDSEPTPETEPR